MAQGSSKTNPRHKACEGCNTPKPVATLVGTTAANVEQRLAELVDARGLGWILGEVVGGSVWQLHHFKALHASVDHFLIELVVRKSTF